MNVDYEDAENNNNMEYEDVENDRLNNRLGVLEIRLFTTNLLLQLYHRIVSEMIGF